MPLVGDTLKPVAVAPVAPTQPKPAGMEIDPDNWQSMASAIRRQARAFSGVSGYVIKDLRSGKVMSSQADRVFLSASLIKLPILCAAFQAAEEGKLSLSAPYTLRKTDKRGGSGVLKMAPVGTVYTNRELLEYMIVNSDNTAAEVIVEQLGFDYLQATFTKLGLKDTEIHPDGFRLTGRPVKFDNLTSPRDMATLLERIYARTLVSPDASDQMLDILKHQYLRDRLPRFMPAGWTIAHKTGLLRKACHDVGIVFSPQGDYMICVLTTQDVNYRVAKKFIASVGRITFNYYQGGIHRTSLGPRDSNTQAS
jgi:beta-lactamase class A